MHAIVLHGFGRIRALENFSEDLKTWHVVDDDSDPIPPAGIDERLDCHSVGAEELGSLGGSKPVSDIGHFVYGDYRRHCDNLFK